MNRRDETEAVRDDVDPEIRRFIETIRGQYARYPQLASMPIEERRRIAATVRAPWSAGGPEMARTTEVTIPVNHCDLRIRIHDPDAERAKPALIYIHGGGWTIFSLDTHDRLMREYAARAGIAVVGVDYSLSPEAKFPTAVEDCAAVARWLARTGADRGIDSTRLAIGGDSAGGNLSVAACLKLRDEGESGLLRAMVLNYGVFDNDFTRSSYERYDGDRYMLTTAEMKVFWRNYVRSDEDMEHPWACPMRADLRGLPPAYMAITECDVLHDENVAMAERLKAADVAVRDVVYPGTSHSFLEAVSIARVSDRALAETAAWLIKTLA